jgi:MFS family permease
MKFGLVLPPQFRVYGGFFIYSFCMGSLPPRLPDIQTAMGIQEGALGFGLIGAALGTLISLSFLGPVLERIGYRRSILVSIPLLALLYAIASFAPGPLVFFLLLLPVGLVIGGIEIILNLEADRTEHMIGRRIMNRAHAFWSFGFFSSGIISAMIAQTRLPTHWHLLLMVPVVVVGVALILGRFNPAPHRHLGRQAPAFRRTHARDLRSRRRDAERHDHGRRRHRLVGDLHARRIQRFALRRGLCRGARGPHPGGDAIFRRSLR